jgi:hypothetical protein
MGNQKLVKERKVRSWQIKRKSEVVKEQEK